MKMAAQSSQGLASLERFTKALDLDCVSGRLADENPDWSEERVRIAVHDYRYFLALCHCMPGLPLVPARDIDEVWHNHILFTEKYGEDCANLFEGMLHHHPYFGIQKDEAITQCIHFLRRMPMLFQEHFGVTLKSYENIETEIAEVLDTKKMTSFRGWSGPVSFAKYPELMLSPVPPTDLQPSLRNYQF